MGSHRDEGSHRDGQRGRRVSRGPVIALVAILAVIALVFGWFKVRASVSNQGAAAAASCVSGDTTVAVTADPSIADAVRSIATTFEATKPIVRDHCVHVEVTAQPSQPIQAALAAGAGWDSKNLGPRPALWIPQSTNSVNGIAQVDGLVDGEAKPIAWSPVVLAVPPALRDALAGAHIGWRDLPRLQGSPNSLAALGLPNWGGLRMAMPTGPASDSTATAIDAIATAVSNAGPGPVPDAAAQSAPMITALDALAAGGGAPPGPKPASTGAALFTLANQSNQPIGVVHAVPVTEQQLAKVLQSGAILAPYAPPDATPVADYPAMVLAGSWIDESQSGGAAEFSDFLRQPAQSKILTQAGFQSSAPQGALRPANGITMAKLMDGLTSAASTATTTVLVDVSSSMSAADGASTRLGTVVDALRTRLDHAGNAAALGLWHFSNDLDVSTPYQIDVQTGPLTPDNRNALEAALNTLAPTSSPTGNSYSALEAAYRSATSGFVAGRTNSVVLITAAADDDSSVAGDQLLRDIATATDPHKPIRVDVIIIGQGSDTRSLQALTDRTDGSLTHATTPAEVAAAVARVLP